MSEQRTADVTVDSEVCMGHGACYRTAPEVFAPDEAGFSTVVGDVEDSDGFKRAVTAARNCPEAAISVAPRRDRHGAGREVNT